MEVKVTFGCLQFRFGTAGWSRARPRSCAHDQVVKDRRSSYR